VGALTGGEPVEGNW